MVNEVYKVAPQNGGARFLFECFNNYYVISINTSESMILSNRRGGLLRMGSDYCIARNFRGELIFAIFVD